MEVGADQTGLQCPAVLGRREKEGGKAGGKERSESRKDASGEAMWEESKAVKRREAQR